MPIIQAPRRLRQKDHECEANLSLHSVILSKKKKKKETAIITDMLIEFEGAIR
jgi:hypothetical protein